MIKQILLIISNKTKYMVLNANENIRIKNIMIRKENECLIYKKYYLVRFHKLNNLFIFDSSYNNIFINY